MAIKTIIDADGTVTTIDDSGGTTTITETAGPAPGHSSAPFDTGAFIAGLFVGMVLLWFLQVWQRSRAKGRDRAAAIGPQPSGRMADEVAALARRTAALETIVTDPGVRTAREIEALR